MTGVADLTACWPDELALRLAVAFSGRDHLAQAAALALETANAAAYAGRTDLKLLIGLAGACALGAFEARPLSGPQAAMLAQLAPLAKPAPGLPHAGALPPAALREAALVAESWRAPADPAQAEAVRELLRCADAATARAELARLGRAEPDNLYWLDHLFALFLDLRDGPAARELLGHAAFKRLPLLRLRLAADVSHIISEHGRALGEYRAAHKAMPWPGALPRAAACALAQGKRDLAAELLHTALAAQPWRADLLCRLHDLLAGRDQALAPLPGPVTVCCYSWNKAELLDQTIASLAASLPRHPFRLLVLDNGSTDATPAMLASWQDRLGDAFTSIRLPINIGAPAARNWLIQALRDDTTLASDAFVAFLDDDAIVPPDWLLRLGAAAHAYPHAGAWGCKVVDYGTPDRLQSVDLHIVPFHAPPEGNAFAIRFDMPGPYIQEFDAGQFDYLRPCASATGCCHIFRADRLFSSGGFDIRFTPSQFDDLDHDLRLSLSGTLPVYTGFLRVEHKKLTGRLAPAQATSGLGNFYKLHAKWSPGDADAVMAADLQALRADAAAKREKVREMWEERGRSEGEEDASGGQGG